MEENFNSKNDNELILDSQSKMFLLETSKWTKFISIIGFIGVGFMVLGSLSAMFTSSSLLANSGIPLGGVFIFAIYLFFSVLYFFPVYYLYKFSENTQFAIKTNNQNAIREAFEFLKSHYRFMGILMIVVLSIYAIFILFAIIGLSAGLMGS